MKAFLAGFLLTTLVLAATASDIRKEIMTIGKACFQEHDVTEAQIDALKSKTVKPEDITENIKCAIHCIMNKSGVMDADGKFKPDTLKSMMNDKDKAEMGSAIDKCSSITGDNPCEIAFLTFGCVHENKN